MTSATPSETKVATTPTTAAPCVHQEEHLLDLLKQRGSLFPLTPESHSARREPPRPLVPGLRDHGLGTYW